MTRADVRARKKRLEEFISSDAFEQKEDPWVKSKTHNLVWWYRPGRDRWRPSVEDPLGEGGRWAKKVDAFLAEHWPEEFESS